MRGAFILLTVVCTAFAIPSCPKENPTDEDVLLSAEDCQHFYKCDHGKAYLMACPSNEEWSQELKRCDWPEVAHCSKSSSGSTSSPTESTPKSTTPVYITCPHENPVGEDVVLPAKDCQHFYKCDHGIPYLMPCPPNQEWSQELKRCDWPEIAQCTSSTGTKPTSNPTEDTSSTQTTPTSKPTTPAYVTCPQENPSGEDVLLPAKDCQHFYKCDHGIPYLIPCPPNQEWSQELKRCDWPEIAQCSSSTGTKPTSNPSENTSPTQTTPTSKPSTPTYVTCPQENPVGEDVLLPAKDCQHFYKCDHGIPYLIPCPPNQEWSQELKRCDWPEIAQCTASSSNIPKTTSPAHSVETSTVNPSPPPNVNCPPETPEEEDVFLPAEDCKHFYKCDHGEPSLQECPDDLEWNHELKQCDWPEVAKCTPSSNITNPVPSSSTGTSAATTPVSNPTTPENPSNICPTGNESETFVPIPGVCDKFYKCDFGVPQIENCPLGTKFSHSMLRCDFPENANCVEGVTGMKN